MREREDKSEERKKNRKEKYERKKRNEFGHLYFESETREGLGVGR